MTYNTIKPHPQLSPYIDAYWTMDRKEISPKIDGISPSGCMTVIYNFGTDFYFNGGKNVMKNEKAYLIGIKTHHIETQRQAESKLVGIRFKSAAFPIFYQFSSLHETTNQVVEFDTKLLPELDILQNDLANGLDAFFLNRINPDEHRLFPIINEIKKLEGKISVEDLAKKHFITIRQLERNFKYYIGLSPKEFINLIRYQFALQNIKKHHPNKSLLDIAFENGYYDHAHLSNEIKKYTGLPPSKI